MCAWMAAFWRRRFEAGAWERRFCVLLPKVRKGQSSLLSAITWPGRCGALPLRWCLRRSRRKGPAFFILLYNRSCGPHPGPSTTVSTKKEKEIMADRSEYVLCNVNLADLKQFESAVTNKLNEGYQLVGGPFIADRSLCQALVRKTKMA